MGFEVWEAVGFGCLGLFQVKNMPKLLVDDTLASVLLLRAPGAKVLGEALGFRV